MSTFEPTQRHAQDSPMLRFLVKKRTTFTWIVPLSLLVASYFWGHWSLIGFGIGVALLSLGEVVRFWAAGYIHKDDTIATDGPYGLVRNPLYLGSLLLALGFVAMSGLGWKAGVIILALFLLFHLAAITSEERFLISKFGESYEEYLKSVPRLFPMPFRKQSSPPQSGKFSMTQALYNREHITLLITAVTAVAFAVLLVYRTAHTGQ